MRLPGYCIAAGRAPHGARGLKQLAKNTLDATQSRAPHGARGLKHYMPIVSREGRKSRPARGTWIETLYHGGGG